ncbi:hypothetical protein [Pseudanabaena sp. PCC 6802]|uniref:hypothetical protein n=1 Tax=Pseudanabaena sp. PCC 6802 TaxID=118173 RepID=UPI00034665DD|nr:hypothetical protein [Pseudanabaena sp. PCC 6802]
MNRNRTNSNNDSGDRLDRDLSYEDLRLVAFLRQNKPIAPEPVINLEQRIMGEISRQAMPPQIKPARKLWRKGLLVASGAIAAGIMSVWAVNRQMQPATISEADRTQIEASLIESWSASVGEDIDETTNSYLVKDLHKETNETFE